MKEASIAYLNSPEAMKNMEYDPYWPKWNSPWWHMALLYEMGCSSDIPKSAAEKMLATLKRQYRPVFLPNEIPADCDPALDVPCPCQLGNIYQILSSIGLNVDEALPWARAWFMRYQMEDGGLTCDNEIYHLKPHGSSIVGTIAPLEAVLYFTNRLFTPEEENFLDRGAQCLIERELRLGSTSEHNADEKEDEQDWLKPCFPRFYLYDVLRGLRFILTWSEKRGKLLPTKAYDFVVTCMNQKFPDGKIIIERHSYEGVKTRERTTSGEWLKGRPASYFPLLKEVSKIGKVSSVLTTQWEEAKIKISQL